MTEAELKIQLREIVQQNDEVTKPRAQQLLPEMLHHIGNPDFELRDTLIYFTLATWIGKNMFDSSELRTLLQTTLDENHLLCHIGEENTDSVFTRSFSVLLIPPILHVHIENAFFSLEEIQWVWRKLQHYLLNEKDLRGYVRGKSWAHAVAHTADALDELVQCSEIGRKQLLEMLELITKVASTEKNVYTHGEDERLSLAIVTIFKRSELTTEEKVEWLESFTPEVQQAGPLPDPEGYQKFINIKHFLRTLYFELLQSEVAEKQRYLETLQNLLRSYSQL
jgi:Protein of unknown function (DUF2785)